MTFVGSWLVTVHLVCILVAARAERQEIVRTIITQTAPCLNVVDLKIFRCAAGLAVPLVALKHRLP
jgi:hypothetical protein